MKMEASIDNVETVFIDTVKIKGREYSGIKLTEEWFQMSNDHFFDLYGFNFVPRGYLFDMVKRKLEKRNEKKLQEQMVRIDPLENFLRRK